jgi:hypothetical protein
MISKHTTTRRNTRIAFNIFFVIVVKNKISIYFIFTPNHSNFSIGLEFGIIVGKGVVELVVDER